MQIPDKIGKYVVRDVLGKGAMGTVYRGFDPVIKRAVALKVISRQSRDQAELDYIVSRFRQEAEAVGRLTHPRIAAIHDFVDTGESVCIVMELVVGKPLSLRMAEGKRFSLREIWSIILQILEGLAYCHAHGVIHRDLKPDNILVTNDGNIKITDFGVARLESSTLTVLGDIVGTPHYMAPEQFAGEPVTPRTDLYQVSVLLYEMLAGTRPFTGTSVDILRQVMSDEPAPPSTINASITSEIDAVVLKAMAKKSDDRYATPRAFAEALKAAFEKSLGETLDFDPAALAGQAPSTLPGSAALNSGTRAPTYTGPATGVGLPSTASIGTFQGATAAKARVLFVDDEQRVLDALRALFRDRYHVFTADSGAQALEFVRRFGMHVVVSDQRMPVMTGMELLRQVRDISPLTVRLLLTGFSDLASLMGSVHEGEVFRYVRKPWDKAQIQAAVADAAAIALDLAAAQQRRRQGPAQTEAAIVVVDTGPSLAEGLRPILDGAAPVRLVATPRDAMRMIDAEEVAVLIADLSAGKPGLVALFDHLKATRPEILAILVTDVPDSEFVIDLVSRGQIFRFLDKPVQVGQLRRHIEAALARYRSFAAEPGLVPDAATEPATKSRDTRLGSRLLARIQSLPSRLIRSGPGSGES